MEIKIEALRFRLIGKLYIGSPSELLPFIFETFGRLGEVKHTGNLTRQIQYASGYSDDDYIHFMGIEVDRIEDVPEGMMAWDITGDSWSVIETKDGKVELFWQRTPSWNWLDQSVPERPCGEFSVECPPEWNQGLPKVRDFRLASHTYVGAPADDEIRLVDYDPSWPEKFEQMKQRLLKLLGPDIALRIEHYGSTSIPGMPAKPVIDILVEIPSFEEARKQAIPAFNSPEIEYWMSDHMRFYIRDKVTGIRTHHLHMAPAGHRIWEGLAFRDYILTHPEDASRYLTLKYELARRHPDDRLAYTNAKEEFVREITDKANLRNEG